MSVLTIIIGSAAILLFAYFSYGRFLGRFVELNPNVKTPAVTMRDDVDYVPLDPQSLLSQHFSAIAAAGPIVGPILAGVMFGWVPALIWILVGAIFIGGVHDFMSLVASIRHQARSMADVIRENVSRRAFLLFLSFVWLALIYIIVAFTDITAHSFVGQQTLEDGSVVSGAGIASSSLMYLALPIIMGILMRYAKLPLGVATIIFLPLVGVSIYAGQVLPVDMVSILKACGFNNVDDKFAVKAWDVILLFYCAVASVTPMWLLLQPRGHLGGYFLYAALGLGCLGLIVSNPEIKYDTVIASSFTSAQPMMPFLFITIACGACSGFHSLIASGTTSKQLKVETDARLIGYGAMLLEAMVAIISLCCVMRLGMDDALIKKQPNLIYATGLGSFMEALGVPGQYAVAFALMAFTTFVYDTLDVCTRLGRYIIQELTGWQDAKGKWLGTILTGGVPVFFVTQSMLDDKGNPVPLWRVFWALFGTSNQLLAALSLLGVTIWLWYTRRSIWIWLVAIPTAWMYVVSSWALVLIVKSEVNKVIPYFQSGAKVYPATWAVLAISSLLLLLAILMLLEAIVVILRRPNPNPPAVPITA